MGSLFIWSSSLCSQIKIYFSTALVWRIGDGLYHIRAVQFSGGGMLCASTVKSHNLSSRLDVLVHAKEVVRVVFAFHLGKAIVVRAVGGAYANTLVGSEEIDIDAATREGG